MEIIKSVNVVVEGKVVDPTPETKLTPKDKLIIKAKELGIETDGLTVAQLEEAIKAKESEDPSNLTDPAE